MCECVSAVNEKMRLLHEVTRCNNFCFQRCSQAYHAGRVSCGARQNVGMRFSLGYYLFSGVDLQHLIYSVTLAGISQILQAGRVNALMWKVTFFLEYLSVPKHLQEVEYVDELGVAGAACDGVERHEDKAAIRMFLIREPG